jgi:hypothetical protein
MDWAGLAQDTGQWRNLVNTVRNLRVVQNAVRVLPNWARGGSSRRAQLHEINGMSKWELYGMMRT